MCINIYIYICCCLAWYASLLPLKSKAKNPSFTERSSIPFCPLNLKGTPTNLYMTKKKKRSIRKFGRNKMVLSCGVPWKRTSKARQLYGRLLNRVERMHAAAHVWTSSLGTCSTCTASSGNKEEQKTQSGFHVSVLFSKVISGTNPSKSNTSLR